MTQRWSWSRLALWGVPSSRDAEYQGVSFSPGGELLVTLEHQGAERLRWWRWHGAKAPEALAGEVVIPQGVAARPLPLLGGIAVTDQRFHISLRAVEDGRLMRQEALPGREAWGLTANRQGTLLAMQNFTGGVLLWDVETWASLGRLEGPQEDVTGLAFSPDGRLLAASSLEGRIVVWEVPSKRLVHVHEERDAQFTHPAFTPDGTELVAPTTSQRLQRLHVSDWSPAGTFAGSLAGMSSVDFSPDGGLFTTTKGGFRVFDTRTNTCLLHHDVDNDFYYSNSAFSPDGTAVAWGEPDGTVSLWGPTPAG
ncbi:WD40 repeat domain-containing protein [Myxococcus landrumensis]|uniref:WD40 repeat domain-containing protein n=1 Tax=Myxococcus landrumensis TaxID=2813577 RepID=A0ABX7N1R9_9BACT|nr:WD40 repeat domain-containing protein [Myxococcus landrumus]QSQ12441.1 WD40 repeat domain-containing protein [Myxococcus landrumus]